LSEGACAHDWVLVHDAARCLITPEQINQLLDACLSDEVGGLLALPLPTRSKPRTKEELPALDTQRQVAGTDAADVSHWQPDRCLATGR